MKLNIIGALPYEQVREDCHAIKDSQKNMEIILRHAGRLARALPGKSLLLPVPSHTGVVNETYLLAREIRREAIATGKRCEIYCPVRCNARESFCELKHQGVDITGMDTGFFIMDKEHFEEVRNRYVKDGFELIIVDNIVDTGTTAISMAGLTGSTTVLAIGRTEIADNAFNNDWTERILNTVEEQKSMGRIVLMDTDGITSISLEEFINRPAEDILHDLNRDQTTTETLFRNGKRLPPSRLVNDLAVAQVITALKTIIKSKS